MNYPKDCELLNILYLSLVYIPHECIPDQRRLHQKLARPNAIHIRVLPIRRSFVPDLGVGDGALVGVDPGAIVIGVVSTIDGALVDVDDGVGGPVVDVEFPGAQLAFTV